MKNIILLISLLYVIYTLPQNYNQNEDQDQDVCVGENRDNNCKCLEGYHDNQGLSKDCIKCGEQCKSCNQDRFCLECREGLDRELNAFTGSCDCRPGYQEYNDLKLNEKVCKKCYMHQNNCLFVCPLNMVANEKRGICQPKEKGAVSNMTLVVILGGVLTVLQFLVCIFIKIRLKKQNQQFFDKIFQNQVILKEKNSKMYRNIEKLNENFPQKSTQKLDLENQNHKQA